MLDVPIFGTICLLSSSLPVDLSVAELRKNQVRRFTLWLGRNRVAGPHSGGTGREWYKLIVHDGLTIRTNLFGTTFYALVGLHAAHVVTGLSMLLSLLCSPSSVVSIPAHAERLDVLSLYWHFVDAVWVVVFTVVYILGR